MKFYYRDGIFLFAGEFDDEIRDRLRRVVNRYVSKERKKVLKTRKAVNY